MTPLPSHLQSTLSQPVSTPPVRLTESKTDSPEVAEKFQEFVAGTFYRQMMKSLRATVGEPAYLGGGQAEQIFRQQLDEQFVENFSQTHGSAFADEMYQVFQSHIRGRLHEPAEKPSVPLPDQVVDRSAEIDDPVRQVAEMREE